MNPTVVLSLVYVGIAFAMAMFGISLSSSIQAQSQEGDGFTAQLSGQDQVPPTESNATGIAEVLFNNDSSHASYFVNITGLENITSAHIHNGSEGVIGEVVVGLSKEKSSENQDNPAIWFSGDILNDDLQGPLEGKEVSGLANLINNGSAYVNIHTEENSDGEVRGQLAQGQVEMSHFTESNGNEDNERQNNGNQNNGNQDNND